MSTRIKKMSQGYGYKYSDLAAIHEELERQGLTYYQYIEFDAVAGADYIFTVLVDSDDKESSPRRGCRVITGGLKGQNPAQEQGSGITYARRYSLLMALGWATEDDDGAAVKPETVKKPQHTADSIKAYLEKATDKADLEARWAKIGGWQKNEDVIATKNRLTIVLMKGKNNGGD